MESNGGGGGDSGLMVLGGKLKLNKYAKIILYHYSQQQNINCT
jgi:hypothetical protein